MSQADILGEITTIVAGVSGVGVVHDFERSSRSPAEWLDIMTSGGKINGWTISREATESEWEFHTTNRLRHVFRIKGYYAVDDAAASEKTFQALVDEVRKAFNGHETLSGDALISGPCQIDYVGIREIAPDTGYYLHVAELTLAAEERETKESIMDGQDLCRSGGTVYLDQAGSEIPPPGPDQEEVHDIEEEKDNDN